MNEVLKGLPVEECGMIVASPIPLQGRNSIYFTNTRNLLDVISQDMFTNIIASMSCLIIFAKTDNFSEAASLIDLTNDLPGPVIKNKKKYVLLMTRNAELDLVGNKSINFNVHIVRIGGSGSGTVTTTIVNCYAESFLSSTNW